MPKFNYQIWKNNKKDSLKRLQALRNKLLISQQDWQLVRLKLKGFKQKLMVLPLMISFKELMTLKIKSWISERES